MIAKAVALYSIFVGISVLAFWFLILSTEKIPEGPFQMTFHLISEFGMAVLAMFGGILLLGKRKGGVPFTFIALGMVLYSVLNAAGYYGQRGDGSFVALFLILTVLTAIALGLLMTRANP